MLGKEIEIKYLVCELPEKIKADFIRVSQYYTKIDKLEEERYRSINDIDYYKTIKKGEGLVREEIEVKVSKSDYDLNKKHIVGNIIEKVRCRIPYILSGKEYIIEVDIYEGTHKGLVVAEVEFDSISDSVEFKKSIPTWFSKEVTEDKRYKNKNLALKSI